LYVGRARHISLVISRTSRHRTTRCNNAWRIRRTIDNSPATCYISPAAQQ